MKTKQLEYKGKRLFYRSIGEGPVVVLLHGFGEDGDIWKGQFALFSDNQLLIPDLPGSGESEALDDMSMEGLADAVKAIIDVEAGSERIAFIGHSMGGYVALAFAEKYSSSLRGLGLFHSTAYADSEEKKETRQKGIRFIEESGAEEFLKLSTPNLYAAATREQHPEWIKEHLAATRNFSADNLVSYYEAMIARPDRTQVLRESKRPVLFVMGQHDTAVPLQDGLAQCHLPGVAYIEILSQSGHMGMIEELNKANQILSQFVNDTEKTT